MNNEFQINNEAVIDDESDMKKLLALFETENDLIELSFAFESIASFTKKSIKKTVQKFFNDASRKPFNDIHKFVEKTFNDAIRKLFNDAHKFVEKIFNDAQKFIEKTFNDTQKFAEKTFNDAIRKFFNDAQKFIEKTFNDVQRKSFNDVQKFIEKTFNDVQKFIEKTFNDAQKKSFNDVQKFAEKAFTIKNSSSKQSSRVNFITTFTNENDDIKCFINLSKNETTAIQKLNTLARRYYLVFLVNKKTDEFVMNVLSKMKFVYSAYKTLRKRCSKFYKQ